MTARLYDLTLTHEDMEIVLFALSARGAALKSRAGEAQLRGEPDSRLEADAYETDRLYHRLGTIRPRATDWPPPSR